MSPFTTHRPRYSPNGFSLVEFLIAISLGLLIVGVIVGIFLSGNRNYAQDERYARLQENARFAMKMLTSDIANDSFWGSMTDLNKLNLILKNFDPGCGLGPTGGVIGALDPNKNFTNNTNNDVLLTDASASAIETKYPCITDAADNSSVLVIKRVQGACLTGDAGLAPPCVFATPTDNLVYLRTNGTDASLFTASSSTASPGGYRDWEFIPRVYYVRRYAVTDGDGIPTLMRKELKVVGGAPTMVSQVLVEGIESFRIALGVSSGEEQPRPIKIHLLVRSLDRDLSYDTDQAGTKTFTLGDACFSVSTVDGCTLLTSPDGTPKHYYRRVVSSVISSRNAALFQ